MYEQTHNMHAFDRLSATITCQHRQTHDIPVDQLIMHTSRILIKFPIIKVILVIVSNLSRRERFSYNVSMTIKWMYFVTICIYARCTDA